MLPPAFLANSEISFAVALVFGGDAAGPEGECAPAASNGFEVEGVMCAT